jgi:hypothetical protein
MASIAYLPVKYPILDYMPCTPVALQHRLFKIQGLCITAQHKWAKREEFHKHHTCLRFSALTNPCMQLAGDRPAALLHRFSRAPTGVPSLHAYKRTGNAQPLLFQLLQYSSCGLDWPYSPPSFNRSPMSPPLATGLTWGPDKRVQVQPFAEPRCLI